MTTENASYVVTGARGHVGSQVAKRLLEAGKKVRVIGRHVEGLRAYVDQGAEMFTGSLADSKAMSEAFRGEVLFTMIPPEQSSENVREHQKRMANAMTWAIKEAGVKYVVNLSSMGAELMEGTGPIVGLHYMEQALNDLEDVHVLHLRAGFFMENLLMSLPAIRAKGIVPSPLRADLRLPLIATRDIGDRAAHYMIERSFTGKVVKELQGQRDLAMPDVVKILGHAIARPEIQYRQVSYEEAEKEMVLAGMSHDSARLMVEMERSLNEGRIRPLEIRSAENTTPTSLEEFAQEFAAAYHESWRRKVA
ncbi:MAG TPA: hypothetical protein DCZ95_01685 [Verrucomicrobia bacterium]|nr:MAG: hypothetical protein A2X46_08580 [Lentisphaerae bacterium GWF2_57_35]HBA82781.1 hypothetical protein [Verrucomicrobiota bacterium]